MDFFFSDGVSAFREQDFYSTKFASFVIDSVGDLVEFNIIVSRIGSDSVSQPYPIGENYAMRISDGTFSPLNRTFYCGQSLSDGTCATAITAFNVSDAGVLQEVVFVPELGTLALLGIGIAGLGLVRRRKR